VGQLSYRLQTGVGFMMKPDLIVMLEHIIWVVIPVVFFGVTSRIFKLVTKNTKGWLFVFLVLVSITGYIVFRPRCASVEIDQIICTAKVAISFNFLLFLFGFIVAFVFYKLIPKNSNDD
jgi:hypothetical protein